MDDELWALIDLSDTPHQLITGSLRALADLNSLHTRYQSRHSPRHDACSPSARARRCPGKPDLRRTPPRSLHEPTAGFSHRSHNAAGPGPNHVLTRPEAVAEAAVTRYGQRYGRTPGPDPDCVVIEITIDRAVGQVEVPKSRAKNVAA
ncbi:hypothetical protein [Streptomyces sp. NPDC047061]|uniref:hypothetical protein n=1 Tax=Streptomyces sp. NPDC047061 TaxID=3154605 RepID=UPI003402C8DD